jgi:hypothetical protein
LGTTNAFPQSLNLRGQTSVCHFPLHLLTKYRHKKTKPEPRDEVTPQLKVWYTFISYIFSRLT